MSFGLRIVSTDCPSGPAEILQGGKLGRLVPPGNCDMLAKALLEAINSEPNCQELSKAVEQYDPTRIASDYLQIFERLLREKN